MPIRKSRLNQAERSEYLAAAQQLQTLKLIPDIPDSLKSVRALDIMVGRGPESLVFDWRGGVGYAIQVRLIARQAGLILTGCQVTTIWDDQILLESSDDERTPIWKLGWLEYPQADVLNQRIADSLRFHQRGQVVAGMILATGLRPLPDAYRHGMFLPFELAFVDQFENAISVDAELFVHRTTKPKNAAVRPRTGLYEPRGTPESSHVLASRNLHAPQRQRAFR